MHPMFTAALVIRAKIRKQFQVSINRKMEKEDPVHVFVCIHIYTHNEYTQTHIHTMGYYSTVRKNKILPFATTTWMIFEGIMLSEISHTEKDKYWILLLIMKYLKKKKNKYNKTETDFRQRANQWESMGRKGEAKQEYGIKKYELLRKK